MARTPRRLKEHERDRVYELGKTGMTSALIAAACAESDDFHKGFKISASHVRTVLRRERAKRGELYRPEVSHLPALEALPALLGRLVETAEREVERLEQLQERGRLDAKRVTDLAGALDRLHRLAKRMDEDPPPPAPGGEAKAADAVPDQPRTFAERLMAGEAPDLADDAEHDEDAPAFADVEVSANGRAPGPAPAVAATVPDAPPAHQRQGRSPDGDRAMGGGGEGKGSEGSAAVRDARTSGAAAQHEGEAQPSPSPALAPTVPAPA